MVKRLRTLMSDDEIKQASQGEDGVKADALVSPFMRREQIQQLTYWVLEASTALARTSQGLLMGTTHHGY